VKLVVKIGGSLSIGSKGPKISYFKRLLPILRCVDRKHQLVVAIGGGKFLRKYFNIIKKFGLTNDEMEWIAVDLLKVNVRFLSFLLKKKPIFSIEEFDPKEEGVIGGIAPRRSTDANAALIAKKMKADLFIKLTDVNGIYDKDPHVYKNAKKLDYIRFSDVMKYGKKGEPGKYGVLDKMCLSIIQRAKIKTIVMNGKKPQNLLRVVKGERIGTLIYK
jgi:uridylate kinase